MKTILVAVTVAALAIAPAHAQTPPNQTALWLAQVCGWDMPSGGAAALPENDVRCPARTFGEIDGVLAGMKLSRVKPWICVPDASSNVEKMLVVRKYIGEHPEALSADIGDVVAAALAQAYPCRR